MKFWITKHCKERYVERVCNGLNKFENLNIHILKELGFGKDITNKIYDEVPRYILFLYEKYKELGQKIYTVGDTIYVLKKRAGTNDLYEVLTCYNNHNHLEQYKKSTLSREEIFMKIKEIKKKLKNG